MGPVFFGESVAGGTGLGHYLPRATAIHYDW
jgi:hypothetical protein